MNRIISRHTKITDGKGRCTVSSIGAASRIGSFGIMMGVSILTGYFLGSYFDRWLGTYPWFMMIFLILFMVGAFVNFFQYAGLMNGSAAKIKTGHGGG